MEDLFETEDYKVSLEIFEGPLDLLLYLIKKEEVDIYDIPIFKITKQYLRYLDLMKMLDLDIAGEFLRLAAELMYIKSRMLLPSIEREPVDEEDIEDPRSELVRKLIEYKKFKDVAGDLEELEEKRSQWIEKRDEDAVLPEEEIDMDDISIFDLLTAFSDVLSRAKEENLKEIFEEQIRVEDKIKFLQRRLKNERSFSFFSIFQEETTRMEIIVTFLAILELIKSQELKVRQKKNFHEILIFSTEEL
ncbi:MAG: segregation/condensation protein A [Candidatus Theseobacter exili]|nr:segregation/condensation protein A [Candidatus Theseobacter exili]